MIRELPYSNEEWLENVKELLLEQKNAQGVNLFSKKFAVVFMISMK